MKKIFLFIMITFVLASAYGEQEKCPTRTFRFTYSVTVKNLEKKAKKIAIWIPLPKSGPYQTITDLSIDKSDFTHVSFPKENKYNNLIFYGEIDLSKKQKKSYTLKVNFVAKRSSIAKLCPKNSKDLSKKDLVNFLRSNKMVPLNHPAILKRIQKAIQHKTKKPMVLASDIYKYLLHEMKYDKSGKGWGRGDAVWACNSQRGNCTDYHSLFISMMRTLKIPARFEIGFPLPEKKEQGEIKGYHCWGWFYVEKLGWIPVDISEADKHPEKKDLFFGGLDSNRIAFTTGRDLEFTPAPQGGAPNFFVYPIVEVDGKSHNFDRKFTFTNIKDSK